uniref:Putative secreted protein n=1 Tax=Ixodes ricinus TaxID=34613 RepID=A0A6B0TY56_IXORI
MRVLSGYVFSHTTIVAVCSCRTNCEVATGEGGASKDRSGNVTDNGRKHLWAPKCGCLAFFTLKHNDTYPNVTASLYKSIFLCKA